MNISQTGSAHSRTSSVWQKTFTVPSRPALKEDLVIDVCVIGAGMAGLSTAYMLAVEGKKVVVVDQHTIGGGETGYTTAHLSNSLDDLYTHMIRLHGREGARMIADSHTAAINTIETTVANEDINCEFTRLEGYLCIPPEEKKDVVDQELQAAHEVGLTDIKKIDRAPIADFDTGPCLHFPKQGQFHPLKYLAGLAVAIENKQGKIFTQSKVDHIQTSNNHLRVSVGKHTITAAQVVMATNVPIHGPKEIDAKQAAYQTYVVGGLVPTGSVTKALYWDTADPYHYVRLETAPDHPKQELLIIGGEDHKTGQADTAEERWRALEQWAKERWPMITDFPYRWSGEIMETMDGVAMIGLVPGEKNMYLVTGDSGMGMTHGTIAGILISDLIQGRENPWAKVYDPARKRGMLTADFFKETFNMVRQYVKTIQEPETASPKEIPIDSGAVIQEGKEKIALYRDPQGKEYKKSAICPHLGCIVGWNGGEKTWDCPCHGSRFDKYGKVVHGPSTSDLKKQE